MYKNLVNGYFIVKKCHVNIIVYGRTVVFQENNNIS